MDTHSTEFEVVLFRSVIQHRPVGRGRHFSMAGMLLTLSQELGPKFQGISNEDVWAALERFYNLRELDVLVRLHLSLHSVYYSTRADCTGTGRRIRLDSNPRFYSRADSLDR